MIPTCILFWKEETTKNMYIDTWYRIFCLERGWKNTIWDHLHLMFFMPLEGVSRDTLLTFTAGYFRISNHHSNEAALINHLRPSAKSDARNNVTMRPSPVYIELSCMVQTIERNSRSHDSNKRTIPSLKLTARSPLKMDGKGRCHFVLGVGLFPGANC